MWNYLSALILVGAIQLGIFSPPAIADDAAQCKAHFNYTPKAIVCCEESFRKNPRGSMKPLNRMAGLQGCINR